MLADTTRFGTLEVSPEQVLSFSEGLLGFEDCRRFVLIERDRSGHFRWLQSLERPELAFVTIEPRSVLPGYEPVVSRWELDRVQLTSVTKAAVLAIVAMAPEVGKLTANLQAPVIVNPETMEARQVISTGPDHRIRQPLPGSGKGASARKTG